MDNIRYKLVCNNKEASFTIHPEELSKVIEAKTKNAPAIFKEGLVLNWNMYSGVVEDKERERIIKEHKANELKYEDPSPFAKLAIENKTVKKLNK